MKCPACEAEFESEAPQCPKCGVIIKAAKAKKAVLTIGGSGRKRSPDDFTKEDLLAGLRSAAKGTPVDGYLPSMQWQDYTATLLELLLKKHLVFPAEIDRELKSKNEE